MEEIDSATSLHFFTKAHKNTLICFSATWCGPCKAAKPALDELARKYSSDPAMDVTFGIVYEHSLGDDIHQYGVRAFPTYVLFVEHGEKEFDRVQGANLEAIKTMISRAGCKADFGEGYSLGGTGEVLSPEEARRQRIAALDKKASASHDVNDDDENNHDDDVRMKDATDAADTVNEVEEKDMGMKDDVMVDPTLTLSTEILETLTESMGFSLIRAQKGLLNSDGTTEGAVEWLMQHQDDDDIDDPIELVSKNAPLAQSYKCNECGKILSNMANLELHANKTGHSDFEESTVQVKPLTDEEKAAKVAEIKNLLKAKREEREALEKIEDIAREKTRREMGKNIIKTKEEMEKFERQRQIQLKKKEKEDFKKERERIRAEIEKDKLERRAHAGKMTSKLGIEGYHPDGIQYDIHTRSQEGESNPHHQQIKIKASTAKMDEYIEKISSYKAGGDGKNCLKILLAYVGNILSNPDEEKYKSINTDNKAYKTKVKPFIGAKSLLLAVGFTENKEKTQLVLPNDTDMDVLNTAQEKLQRAFDSY